jgi:hypothetical protein
VVLLVLAGSLLVGGLAIGAFIGVRIALDRWASDVSSGGETDVGPAQVPTGAHRLTGTFAYPAPCQATLAMRVEGPDGNAIAEVPMNQKEQGDSCEAPFATNIRAEDSYSLALVMSDRSVDKPVVVPGPTYSAGDLADANYHLDLTLDDFGGDMARAAVEADLNKAIAAAKSYYDRHHTFVGLTPSELHRLEPSLRFDASSTAGKEIVSLRSPTATTVLFAERTSEGTPIVMGLHPPQVVCYGELDTDSFKKCIAWQPWDPNGDGTPQPQPSPIRM